MSLIVWYPLNGNILQCGILNPTLNITSDLAYSEEALSQGSAKWSAADTKNIFNKDALTICFWLKVLNSSGNANILFGNSAMTKPNNRKFSIFNYPTINDLHLSWQNSTSDTTFISGIITNAFPTGTWVHCAIRYKNPTCEIFLDGIKKQTYTGACTDTSFGYETEIFNNNIDRLLKDFRIYSHAISDKEIELLSRGLYLHYPMNQNQMINEQDCSGFNHVINLLTAPLWSVDSPIGQGSYNFADNKKIKMTINPNNLTNSYTFSWWGKTVTYASKMMWGFSDGNHLNFYSGLYCNTGDGGNNPFKNNGNIITSPTVNVWHHFVITGDGTQTKLYLDGQLYGIATTYIPVTGTTIYLNGWNNSTSYNFNGQLCDFRIYTTPLSNKAIKELYSTAMVIDDIGNCFINTLVETGNNLAEKTNEALINSTFSNGLTAYTQTNCKVTIENNSIHIYRPPNIAADEHNMWGGAKIQFNSLSESILQKGHSYIIMYHVKGQTSNAQQASYFSNNMGWSVANSGLNPAPSEVSQVSIPANFDGEMDCYYSFTINDDIKKTCAQGYSSFVAGTQYISYRDFCIGWGYTNTGSMGTDIYISNIRLYDITTDTKIMNITKDKIINSLSFQNNQKKFSIYSSGQIESFNFIES